VAFIMTKLLERRFVVVPDDDTTTTVDQTPGAP